MKLIFTILVVMSFSQAFSQKFEIGAVGGGSNTLRAGKSLYTGNEGKWNFTTGVNFHLNINPHFQAGLDVGMTRWERSGDWTLNGYNNQSLGSKEVNYLFAKRAVNVSLRLNYVIPFYSRYEDFVRSSLYVGASFGGIVTGSDGDVEYSRANPNTPAEYRYVSEYEYNSGYGTALGLQAGYTYFFSKLIGINIEVAPKVAWVKTVDANYTYGNDTYNILYLPATLGLRIRFGEIYN